LLNNVFLNEIAWQNTFPHRVSPLHDEWLPGLLLRCDEANHWGCRTTLTYLLARGPEKFHRCWRTETPNLIILQSAALNLNPLAQRLSLPTDVLIATTYHMELVRLYDPLQPHPRFLGETKAFHLCPACVAEARLLRRALILPHVTLCPQHHFLFIKQCRCGTSLGLFHRQARPFACHLCGGDWANLPRIEAHPSQVVAEQRFLAWYAFFFSQGMPQVMRLAMRLADKLPVNATLKRLPLGELVALLVQRGHSPQNVQRWMERASQQGTM
jgi:hypothetical protein